MTQDAEDLQATDPQVPDPRVTAAAEKAAAVLAALGFPPMPARVLVALLASETGSLTASDLTQALGVSAAAISGAVRYLEMIGTVHRVSQHGSRRRRWELADSWYGAMTSQVGVYERSAAGFDQLVAALEPGSAAHARAADSAGFMRFIGTRVPELLREWGELRDRTAP